MMKKLLISLTVLGVLGQLQTVNAQIESSENVDSLGLPEAVVIAGRGAMDRTQVGHTFEVLTRSQLETLPISSTTEALQYVGGLDLRQRGANGVQADLSIRGGTFDQVLVLINGVALTDPQTGHHLMNIPVPLDQVERIEVLKGPGARMYGANGFAGAINIVTRPEEEASTTLRAEAGENGLGGFGVAVSLPMENVRQSVSYSRDFSDGYRYNTDYSISNIYYQLETSKNGHDIGIFAGLSDREFGANGFYASAAAVNQYEEVQTSVVALTHRTGNEKGNYSQRLSWRHNKDEYVFIRSNPSIYRNLHLSDVFAYDAVKSFNNSLGELRTGSLIRYTDLESNNLGRHGRGVLNVFVEQEFDLLENRLRVTPGLTLSYVTESGARFLPGLDVLYKPTPATSIYANYGSTFRIPTYTNLFYSDRYNAGNPDLETETAQAIELGAEYDKGGLLLGVSGWVRDGSNLIDYVRTSLTDTVWQPENIAEGQFTGVEVRAAARRQFSWLPLVQLSYAYIDADLELPNGEASEYISRYALDQLTHQLTATAIFQVAKPLSATISYRLGDRVSQPATDGLPVDYNVVDLRVDYRRPLFGTKRVGIFAEAKNLFDEAYTQTNGVPLPGRWVRGGIEVKL